MPMPMPTPRHPHRFLHLLLGGALLAARAQELPGLPPGHSVRPRAVSTDALGRTHTRLEHRYQGLRVWGTETIAHATPGAAALDDPAVPLPRMVAPELDVVPSIAKAQARAAVAADLGGAGFAAAFEEPELVLVPRYVDRVVGPIRGGALNAAQLVREPAGHALAYLQRVDPSPGGAGLERWDYLVDAHAGTVLERIPVTLTVTPAKVTGETLFSGKVTLDVTQVTQGGYSYEGFRVVDRTRGTGGAYEGNFVADLSRRIDPFYFSQPGYFRTGPLGSGEPEQPWTSPLSPLGQTVLADAAFGMQVTWDYFKNVHGRRGIDNQGGAVGVHVHAPGRTDNAGWSNGGIYIFPSQVYWSMADVGTLGHEWAHGVTEATAKLVYRGEPGGLNEATADIFGAMVQAYAVQGDWTATQVPAKGVNWLVELRRIVGAYPSRDRDEVFVVRSMIQPSVDHKSPDTWVPELANLNPHYASGPMNRAFYFLSQGASSDPKSLSYAADLPGGMRGVGNDQAARIWYQALTSYLKPDSTYRDARNAALAAATDLYGATSDAVAAVRKAFAAIRVGSPDPPPVVATPAITLNLSQSGSELLLSATTTSIKSVSYMLDGVPVGSAGEVPFNLTLDGARLLANGVHTLTAYALDALDAVTLVQGPSFGLDNPHQQLLKDPGLELGAIGPSPWRGDTFLVNAVDFQGGAHAGIRYARFDRSQGRDQLGLGQAVTIPAGSREATLGLWAWISTDPTDSAKASLSVRVRSVPAAGEAPEVLATLLTLGPQDAWPDWVRYSLDLTPYAGRTVEIFLESQVGGDSATVFRVDDLSVLCAASPVVDVAVSPSRVALLPGAARAFEASVFGSDNQAVVWSLRETGGGALKGNSYTAPVAPGFYHLVATSVADPAARAEVSVQVLRLAGIEPDRAVVEAESSRRFQLQVPAGMRIGLRLRETDAGGAYRDDVSLTYYAGSKPGVYHLDLYEVSDPSRTLATATVTVVEATTVKVFAQDLTVAAGASLDIGYFLTSRGDFLWTIQEGEAGGTLGADPSGPLEGDQFYTAPATPGTYHVVITSALNPARRGSITVTVVGTVAITPATQTILVNDAALMSATVPNQAQAAGQVRWTASGGNINEQNGDFTPSAPGTYLITATPTTGGAKPGTAIVIVKSADLDGDGPSYLDFGDLAAVVDAYGTDQGGAADLTGDGAVDDQDVSAALGAFEESPAASQGASARRVPAPLPRRIPGK